MKSENATFWQILKHLFWFHKWSEWRTSRYENQDPNSLPCVYRICEICAKESTRKI